MLDPLMIRNHPEAIREALAKRGVDVDFSTYLADDEQRRRLIAEGEALKAKRNQTSADIPQLKKAGVDVSDKIAEMREVGDAIARIDGELLIVNTRMADFLDRLPNRPLDDVVAGDKEANAVVSTWGAVPQFDFAPKHHVELATSLHLIDYERGAKIAGNGFWVYTGWGARLEWALLSFFIDSHLKSGYEMMLLPHIVNEECGYASGQFPKFVDDIYRVDDHSDAFRFLLPTAETALVGLHMQEIMAESDLPKKYFAYTPCYRREAGSYRADERGMVRGHQFNKVEMFQLVTPDNGRQALDELIAKASALVEALGLHHQVSKLAAGDISHAMQTTYDIEVYLPSMGGYKEVSSASWAGDYQARRGGIRYRDAATGKVRFVHTLNASGLATSRIVPALLEQNQNADGSVTVPPVLRPYLGGLEALCP